MMEYDPKPTSNNCPEVESTLKDLSAPKGASSLDTPMNKRSMSARALAAQIGSDKRTVRKAAEKYRSANPRWFRSRKFKNGRIVEVYGHALINKITADLRAHTAPPPMWKSLRSLRDQTGATAKTLQRALEVIRPQFTNEIAKHRSPTNGTVCEFLSPPASDALCAEVTRAMNPPAGWITLASLAKEIGFDPITVRKAAARLSASMPDQLGTFCVPTAGECQMCSPSMAKQIQAGLFATPLASAQEYTTYALAMELASSYRHIEHVANQFRTSNPEWFVERLSKRRQVEEHYVPELVAIITEKVTGLARLNHEYQRPLPGAVTIWSIAQAWGVNERYVQNIANRINQGEQITFHANLNAWNYIANYISPELAAKVRTELLKVKFAPHDYISTSVLAQSLDVSRATVIAASKQLKSNDKTISVGHRYLTPQGRIMIHYSPQVSEQISSLIKSGNYGWHRLESLFEKKGIAISVAEAILNSCRSEHPTWFKDFAGRYSSLAEFADQRFKLHLEQVFNKAPGPPAGWTTSAIIAHRLQIAAILADRVAMQIAQTNPVLCQICHDKLGLRINHFYSPEMTGLVSQQLGNLEQAPSGAISMTKFCARYGIAESQVFEQIPIRDRAQIRAYIDSNKIADVYMPRSLASAVRTRLQLLWSDSIPIDKAAKSLGLKPEIFKVALNRIDPQHDAISEFNSQEYIARKALKLIQGVISSCEQAPKDWSSLDFICKRFQISKREAVMHCARLWTDRPSAFGEYSDSNFKVQLYLSPQAVHLLEAGLSTNSNPT